MNVWLQDIDGVKSPMELSSTPLAGGGEGNLYEILSPKEHQHLLAKIYHPNKRTELRYKKLLYLHQYPPLDHTNVIPANLIWPQSLLFDEKDQFIGFVMPRASGEKLELLCLPKIPEKFESTWGSYDFLKDKDFKKRLGIAFKLAQTIHHIHKTEHYVLVDMKPDNVMVTPEGAIFLVDLDSVEVIENGKTLYDAAVATPEYTPPDSYLKDAEVDPTQEEPWDRFGLAVMMYKLLLGVHPFAASSKGPYESYTSLYQKIEHGLFVHNPQIKPHLSVVPDLHDRFHNLPFPIQQLFERCFIEGHLQPFARPSAKEWMLALAEYNPQYAIQDDELKIPTVSLEHLPKQLNLDKLFELPTMFVVSQAPKLQLEKPLDKKELKNHHLPTTIQDPKQIGSQRFFNFMVTILIVVVATAMSLIMPWQLTLVMGIIAYLGFNYVTYKTRKSADRKESIMGILNAQLGNFEDLVGLAETYEKKIVSYIDTIKAIQLKKPKEYLEDILDKRALVQHKINEFTSLLNEEKEKLQTVKREERVDFKNLHQYYLEQAELKTQFPQIQPATLDQKIMLLKRAKRLNKLTAQESLHYATDLITLEELNTQLVIEETELQNKHSEKFQNILFRCEESYNSLLDEIQIYNQSIDNQEEEDIKSFIEQQRISLQELERLQYDLRQLEKPLDDQVKSCRRAQQDAELYKKINYGRHLLEMVGLARPL